MLERAHAEALPVLVVTGRMVQSLDHVLEPLAFREPRVCYQGAVVVDADGTWLRPDPLSIADAKDIVVALRDEGYMPNVYVGDELYVEKLTPWSDAYAGFQHLQITPVGDLLEWIDVPPTKLVAVGEPDDIDELEVKMKAHFGDRLYITQSLPHFLEFATAGVTKASGLEFLAERLGIERSKIVAFGDGENDVELIEWAGFGVAVENAHDRVKAVADWVCGPAADESVAGAIEAVLDSRP